MTDIEEKFGNRLRVRVCGLLIENDALLLVKHKGLGSTGELWIPPGGGVDFGESLHDALVREFFEETGLHIEPRASHSLHEHINPPLHALELFYFVERKKDSPLTTGYDPELNEQIINEVRFVTFDEIQLIPHEARHNIIQRIQNLDDLLNLTSGFNI